MKIKEYAQFLKQPLKLEMFVPCDEEGNVLEFPLDVSCLKYGSCSCGSEDYEDCKEYKSDKHNEIIAYQKAKEKVLFEGFEATDFEQTPEGVLMNSKKWKSVWMIENRTIEEMVYTNATLTPSAIKQIGCNH